MNGMATSPAAAPRRYPGRLLVALGMGIAAVGICAYAAEVTAGRLKLPWYLPVSGMLGAACLAVALWRARSVWRALSLALLILLSCAEWAFLLGTRLPAYAGTQLATGEPFPAFETATADGTPFTRRDLEGDRDTVMVFFRGRW
jgi:hypothetical protein